MSREDINRLYDTKLKLKTDAANADADEQLAAVQSEKAGLDGKYKALSDAAAAEYEKQRSSFNNTAAASGLNTGAASQAALAMNVTAQRAENDRQLQKESESSALDAKIDAITAQRKNALSQALLENDYERAEALMQEEKSAQSSRKNEAALLARYGDFSLYSELYGEDTADAMRELWIAKNPKVARNLGIIDETEYARLTAK